MTWKIAQLFLIKIVHLWVSDAIYARFYCLSVKEIKKIQLHVCNSAMFERIDTENHIHYTVVFWIGFKVNQLLKSSFQWYLNANGLHELEFLDWLNLVINNLMNWWTYVLRIGCIRRRSALRRRSGVSFQPSFFFPFFPPRLGSFALRPWFDFNHPTSLDSWVLKKERGSTVIVWLEPPLLDVDRSFIISHCHIRWSDETEGWDLSDESESTWLVGQ